MQRPTDPTPGPDPLAQHQTGGPTDDAALAVEDPPGALVEPSAGREPRPVPDLLPLRTGEDRLLPEHFYAHGRGRRGYVHVAYRSDVGGIGYLLCGRQLPEGWLTHVRSYGGAQATCPACKAQAQAAMESSRRLIEHRRSSGRRPAPPPLRAVTPADVESDLAAALGAVEDDDDPEACLAAAIEARLADHFDAVCRRLDAIAGLLHRIAAVVAPIEGQPEP